MKEGRPPADLFETLSGILWLLVIGCQWNQLPERYGKWNSVYGFHLRWAKKGVFDELSRETVRMRDRNEFKVVDGTHVKVHQDACHFHGNPEAQGFGKTRGGRNSKLSTVTNGRGRPPEIWLAPGNEADLKSAPEVLGEVNGGIVLADKGYDSDRFREGIIAGGGVPVIPGKRNQKRPVFYVKEVGRKRYVVENYFCRIKRFRRIGTRYDRFPETFLSFVNLASIMDWLRRAFCPHGLDHRPLGEASFPPSNNAPSGANSDYHEQQIFRIGSITCDSSNWTCC